MSENAITAAALREPSKPETKLGWWFMRKFRAKEVARRTARNEIIAAAWIMGNRYDAWAELQTEDAGRLFADSRDRLWRAIDAYNEVS
jgi:hypothetical protein